MSKETTLPERLGLLGLSGTGRSQNGNGNMLQGRSLLPSSSKSTSVRSEERNFLGPGRSRKMRPISDQPFFDLGKAFTAFFAGKAGRPKFKSKKTTRPSFSLANDQFELADHRIWIPKLGWVNMAENIRLKGNILGTRVTRGADWWFISIAVESEDRPGEKKAESVGLDVGLNRLATLSTGEGFENQRFLRTALKKLRQAQQHLARCQRGAKTAKRLAAKWLDSITRSAARAMMSCTN